MRLVGNGGTGKSRTKKTKWVNSQVGLERLPRAIAKDGENKQTSR